MEKSNQVVINAAYRLRAETLNSYVKRLKKLGIKTLGRGQYADVFQHPTMPDVVVKLLTDNDPCYEAYVEFSRKTRNKYTPKILDVVSADQAFDVKGKDDLGDLRLVFMEKLEPLHYNRFIDFGEHVGKLAGFKSRFDIESALMDVETWIKVSKQKVDPDLAKLAKFLVKINKTGVKGSQLDLHDGNMMVRGTQVVITDPFASY